MGDGFNNPVANAGGTLIKTLLKSINYVAGLAGWQIAKNGNAEFNNGSFRGIIKVIAANGSEIDIDAANINPQVIFYSPDKTVDSFINAPNFGLPNVADLGLNSGRYTPADGVVRRGRLFFNDSSDITVLHIMRDSDQSLFGGFLRVQSNAAYFGYQNTLAGVNWFFSMGPTGQVNWTINPSDTQGGFNINSCYLGFGGLKRVDSVAGTGPIGAETVVLTSPSMTFQNGRAYSVQHSAEVAGSVANLPITYLVRRTSLAGAQKNLAAFTTSPAVGTTVHAQATFYVKNASGADITDVLVLTLTGSGGNASEFGSGLAVRYLEVRDVGPSSQYLAAVQI